MSNTTILKCLKAVDPCGPSFLTAEVAYLSCGYPDDHWGTSDFMDNGLGKDLESVRHEMEMALDGLRIALPTHGAALEYFRQHAFRTQVAHVYPTYHMWLKGKYANYRVSLRSHPMLPACIDIAAVKSVKEKQ